MKLIDSFRRSAAQLRDLRSLTGASLLLALSILLTYFFRLDFGGSLSVGLSFNATALMGMLFGPVVTGLANGLGFQELLGVDGKAVPAPVRAAPVDVEVVVIGVAAHMVERLPGCDAVDLHGSITSCPGDSGQRGPLPR